TPTGPIGPTGPDDPGGAKEEAARMTAAPVAPGSALILDGRRRRPAQIIVHVPVTTALGLDHGPCELLEIGPVDADLGRVLLATAELRKACVDATTGEVLHVEDTVVRPVADPRRTTELRRQGLTGEQAQAQAQAEAVRAALLDMVHTPSRAPVEAEPQYRPSAGLSRLVKTRQPRCDFLTCSCPSRQCDDEHTDRWPHGRTRADNLAPRSRWCHQRKQDGWTPKPLPDGSLLWRSPSGRQYQTPPQYEPPPPLQPGAALPPPAPPPPRDDDGPPVGHDSRTDQPLHLDAPADPPVADPCRGWPEDPPF
ncbi:MAG TPA: hypothetical protein VM433_03795, partial [Mycobacteriales bacterium]|nr:hypothetical protein [Mycobacteriales bacterium]